MGMRRGIASCSKLHGRWRSDAIDAYLQAPIRLSSDITSHCLDWYRHLSWGILFLHLESFYDSLAGYVLLVTLCGAWRASHTNSP